MTLNLTASQTQTASDSLATSRLPVPEPSVFAGDPIRFIEWKFSFIALIEGKCISSAEKLFYLKRYVCGPVSKALEGIFFRTDDEAYHDASEKLNCQYGHPFAIHRAFRDTVFLPHSFSRGDDDFETPEVFPLLCAICTVQNGTARLGLCFHCSLEPL